MPYKISKQGNKFKVISPSGTRGTHSSRKSAERQIRAIYANYKPKKKKEQ